MMMKLNLLVKVLKNKILKDIIKILLMLIILIIRILSLMKNKKELFILLINYK
jgi:hypothetical protein